MRILVTGAQGQLGRELARIVTAHELMLTDRDTLDITKYRDVRAAFERVRPDAVIHCAAYTNVDGAESDFDGAYSVNVIGTQNLAAMCADSGCQMVYVSTDYVFDGNTTNVYREYDKTHPINHYGKTKLLGEEMLRQILDKHYIVRTAWLYGDGHNFVRTMLKLAKEKDQLSVVDDQVGSPTYTKDLAQVIYKLLEEGAYGTYHASCNGKCSWYEFACKIFELTGIAIPVAPVATEAFPRPARRPKYSVLDNYMLRMTVGDPMRNWQEALKDYLGTVLFDSHII